VRLAALVGIIAAGLVATAGSAATHPVVPRMPGALAIGPNGILYIADDARNEVLERLPDGTFKVFARGLKRPGGMVLGRDGTLYVADTGSNRLRAISPRGRLTTVAGTGHAGWVETGTAALAAPLWQPADVKLAPNGDLVIATGREVLRLAAAGRLVRIAGTRRYGGVYGIGGRATNASADGPDGLTFDASGNLFLAGFDTKALLMVTPAGTMRLLDDAFYPRGSGGLVTAPDGSALAMDTMTVVRISPSGVRTILDFTRRPVAGIRNFLPNGIAVARNGDVYLDTDAGNGWTNRTALIVVRPTGATHVLWAAPR
jgi:DNA-binding beta-propeller fold protein YncE